MPMEALKGVRVIDLSRILSGPFCTMTLGDMGAEIIKIESLDGDDTRAWGPPFLEGESSYYLSVNRNKKSVVINLKTDKGRRLLLDLVKTADVVVENFRPGTLERLGIGYSVLEEANPMIVLASISGFGQTGPYANRPGYDVIAQGMGGLMSVTGELGGAPVKVGYSVADVGTGLWAAFGIMVALFARERIGHGQWVDASLLETMISWQTYLAGNFFATGVNPQALGGAHPNICPYQVFSASDGYFNLAVGNDSLWEKCCTAIGLNLAEDLRFKTNAKRVENRNVLVPVLEQLFRTKTVREWVELFEKAEIPCGPVNRFSDLYSDPHVLAREMLVEVQHPTIGSVKMTGIPVKFSDTPGRIVSPPPQLGEHTQEVLVSLGYSKEQIQQLYDEHVVTR